MSRIEKMVAIANEIGVNATIKEVAGNTFASVNGVTFVVRGFASFEAKCKELKGYQPPAPIDLTFRLTKIEEKTLERFH